MAPFEETVSATRAGRLDNLGDTIMRIITLPLALIDIFMSALQRRTGIQRFGYIFVIPNLLIFGIFIILPMLLNFFYAFTTGTSILPENRTFVGMANISQLLTCEDYSRPLTCNQDLFWRGVGNTARFVLFEVTLIVALAMITALALNRKIRARGFFRSVFFYPVLLSPVVVGLMWKWILQQNGLLNGLITAAGGDRILFLTDANWAQFWMIVISVWAQMGFYTLILLAGLQSIPSDLYEAASIDGAGAFARFRSITLPLWRPTLLVVTVLTVIRAVQVFDLVYVLTGGGPGTATLYMIQFIYQTAFDDRNFGLAAAASLLLAVVLLIFTVIQLRARRASGEDI
ncbi:sugar ABC transporter permease [Kamptonema cortianum]|nr:sugar ABC transporter permease [Geitlerinema splendidum]MDK3160744.1 sugar ABC transporter permease [Kamptonema cortianum]